MDTSGGLRVAGGWWIQSISCGCIACETGRTDARICRCGQAGDRDGRRVVALALMQARPEWRDFDVLIRIGHSSSAFEQYQAVPAIVPVGRTPHSSGGLRL